MGLLDGLIDKAKKIKNGLGDAADSVGDAIGKAADAVGDAVSSKSLSNDVSDVGDALATTAKRSFNWDKVGKAVDDPSLANIGNAALETATSAATLGIGKALIFRTPLSSSANPDYAKRPSADSSPDEIGSYIDKAIGKTPRDDDIVHFLTQTYPNFSKLVGSDTTPSPMSPLQPYTDNTQARMATGNIPNGLSLNPYNPLDSKILDMLSSDPRMTQLYLRQSDPAKLLPYLPPELGPKNHKSTLWSMARDGIGDVAGRPIGWTLNALSWPSQQVETFVGQNIIFNDVKDPNMRRQLAKISYNYGITQTDWHFNNPAVHAITARANDISAEGLTGDAAWKALQPTLADNMSTRAGIMSFAAKATLDPLNFLNLGIGGAAKAGSFAIGAERSAAVAEKAGMLRQAFGNLPRLAGPGREILGTHTAAEILQADRATYDGWRVALPTRGGLLRLFEQSPGGFSNDAVRAINAVFPNDESLTPEALGVLDKVFKTGEVDADAARILPTDFLNTPGISRFAQITKQNKISLAERIFAAGKTKPAEGLANFMALHEELTPKEFGGALRDLITGHVGSIAQYEQAKYLPPILARIRPVINAEKYAMGLMTFSKPGFIPLNMVNNAATLLWHATPKTAGDWIKTLGQSYMTEMGSATKLGGYPDAFRTVLNATGHDVHVAEDIMHSGTSAHDLLSLHTTRVLQGNATGDEGIAAIRKAYAGLVANPAKSRDAFSLKAIAAWPVTIAGRVDIANKRAAYIMSLKEQLHWAVRDENILPGFRDLAVAKGFEPGEADMIAQKVTARLRDQAKLGHNIFDAGTREAAFRGTIADLQDELVAPRSATHYMLRWAQEQHGLSGDAAWQHSGILQDIEPEINNILDDLPDISMRQRDARISNVADNLHNFDYAQSILTHSQPLIRQGFDYADNLHLTENSLRQSMVDNIGHLDRLMGQTFDGRWNGKIRRDFYDKVSSVLQDHVDELGHIRQVSNDALAHALDSDKNPIRNATADLWEQFWKNKDARTNAMHDIAAEAIGKVHEGPLERLAEWRDNNLATSAKHKSLVDDALENGDKDKWKSTAQSMRNLYAREAKKNAEIFGWPEHNNPVNYGHARPSALIAQRADDFTTWLKTTLKADMAPVRTAEAADRTNEIKSRMREINRAFRPPPAAAPITEEVAPGLAPAVKTRFTNETNKLNQRSAEIDQWMTDNAPKPVTTTPSGEARLPSHLAGAKERYRDFSLDFESDLDRAAYIASQPKRVSKKDADYVQFVIDHTGLESKEVREYGRQIRESMKGIQADEDGVMHIPEHPGLADRKDAMDLATNPKPGPWAAPKAGTGTTEDALTTQMRATLQTEKEKIAARLEALNQKLNPPAPEPVAAPPAAPFVPDNADALKAERQALRDELKGLESQSPEAAIHEKRRNLLGSVEGVLPDFTKDGQDIAQTVRANAMAKTDFAMLNYNQQFGIDSLMQVFFPFMFFGTRQTMNWGIRIAKAPGSAAFIAKMLTAPEEYNKIYGYPSSVNGRIPVPIPFLDHIMSHMPIASKLMQDGQLGHAKYWINPMQMLFPMAQYANDYQDEQKKSTPLGAISSWLENNTPLSLNPVAKILGSESGFLDKDAWEQNLFSGGPFGIPVTPTARAVAAWMQNGEQADVPEEEKNNYTNGGYFSNNFLTRVLGLSDARFDVYRSERSLWAMVAQGDVDSNTAWQAMQTHSGPAWRDAVRFAQSEQFLREFTGSIFARVSPISEGELKLKMGIKGALNEATLQGPDAVNSFYAKFPEYRGYQAAIKGLSDPADREKAVETENYYKTLTKYTEQPFQLDIDRMGQAINVLTHQTQTEATRNELSIVRTQLASVKLQQRGVRAMIDQAFPNREQELSINRDPLDRALAGARADFYGLTDDQTPLTPDQLKLVQRVSLHDNPTAKDLRDFHALAQSIAAAEPKVDLTALQQQYLQQFPPKTSNADPGTYRKLTEDSLTTKMQYGIQMSAALEKGDFDTFRTLQARRDGQLQSIHDEAQKALTRDDVEQYLHTFEKPPTPEETAFKDANNMFDLWMALVGTKSVLDSTQKAAVSSYFRSRPEMQQFYHSETIPLFMQVQPPTTRQPIAINSKGALSGGKENTPRNPVNVLALDPRQIYALDRRKEIWSTYYAKTTDEAKLDYMHQNQAELTNLNALLGMGKVNLIDYEGGPPQVSTGNADGDFKRDLASDNAVKELAIKSGKLTPGEQQMLEGLVAQRDPSKLTEQQIDRFIQMSQQRGY